MLNEIEEFYSYVEMPQVAENLRAWEGSFEGSTSPCACSQLWDTESAAGWIDSTFSQRKAHVERLLEGLEHRDAEFRFTNARRLLYVLQGAHKRALQSNSGR